MKPLESRLVFVNLKQMKLIKADRNILTNHSEITLMSKIILKQKIVNVLLVKLHYDHPAAKHVKLVSILDGLDT